MTILEASPAREKGYSLCDAEALLGARDLQSAIAAFTVAEQNGADPDRCCGGRWMAHMLKGDFAAAWRESDIIRSRGFLDPHRFWNGESLQGKHVIVRCLHGFGDAVQFLRYASRMREMAAHLTVEVPPKLLELAPYFQGIEDVITWGPAAPRHKPIWDMQVEVTELPYIFRTSAADLPLTTEYITLPPQENLRGSKADGNTIKARIGVVWASGDWDAARSIPLRMLSEFMSDTRCEFWNLQGGKAREDWRLIEGCAQLVDAAECESGIFELAAAIVKLDLVVTVDTLAAHLAGALGKRAWVLLPYASDWRWLVKREDSPWYPTLRLFRQPSPGDWRSVVDDLKERLGTWLQQGNGTGQRA